MENKNRIGIQRAFKAALLWTAPLGLAIGYLAWEVYSLKLTVAILIAAVFTVAQTILMTFLLRNAESMPTNGDDKK